MAVTEIPVEALLTWKERLELLEPLKPVEIDKSQVSGVKTAIQRNEIEGKQFGVRTHKGQHFLIRIK